MHFQIFSDGIQRRKQWQPPAELPAEPGISRKKNRPPAELPVELETSKIRYL